MTPLAHQIFKNSLQPPATRRRFVDPYGVTPKLRVAHCFEVSDVWDLARTLLDVGKQDGPAVMLEGITIPTAGKEGVQRLKDMAGRYCFLPAPVTWIEWKLTNSVIPRTGLLLQMLSDEIIGVVVVCNDEGLLAFSFDKKGDLEKTAIYHQEHESTKVTTKEQVAVGVYIGITISLLALINTPKIIGREQHKPHVGLQKTLARSMGSVGKYPLPEWTEVKLRITPPRIGNEDGSHEGGHLTGARALHFCRSHLRLRLGRIELVTAHWRGDPSLGIKRSRYTVVK